MLDLLSRLGIQIPIYARSQDLGHLLELKTVGATDAILETTEVLHWARIIANHMEHRAIGMKMRSGGVFETLLYRQTWFLNVSI